MNLNYISLGRHQRWHLSSSAGTWKVAELVHAWYRYPEKLLSKCPGGPHSAPCNWQIGILLGCCTSGDGDFARSVFGRRGDGIRSRRVCACRTLCGPKRLRHPAGHTRSGRRSPDATGQARTRARGGASHSNVPWRVPLHVWSRLLFSFNHACFRGFFDVFTSDLYTHCQPTLLYCCQLWSSCLHVIKPITFLTFLCL